MSGEDNNTKLTKVERLLIVNHLKILEKLYPEEAREYSKEREALEKGFTLQYRSVFDNLYEEMSEEACKEVLDILNMYRSITFSFKELPHSEGIDEKDLKFEGFDGNNETSQYSYVQYYILRLGCFEELRYDMKYPDYNSHSPRLPKYRRMLATWRKCEDSSRLTAAEIKKIIES